MSRPLLDPPFVMRRPGALHPEIDPEALVRALAGEPVPADDVTCLYLDGRGDVRVVFRCA